jgi:cytochrome c biogenesis protein CcmG/thiol:disulfide interchange protein DsbE
MPSSKRLSDLKIFAGHKCISFVGALLLISALFLLAPPQTAFAALKKGQPAPSIKVTTTSGQSVTLDNYQGRVLLLDFFASWCHPCVTAIPHLVDLNRKYGRQGLYVLGLSLDEEKEDLLDFIGPKKLNYPVALADEELQISYGLRSIPTLVLIDKKGIVVDIYRGLTDQSAKNVELAIKNLLAE